MTKPNSTELVLVVDRSGSMQSIAKAMSDGLNELVNKQRQLQSECKVTLVDFDDRVETVYTARALNEVTNYVLEPRGTTSLLDAVGLTMNATGKRLSDLAESDRPSQVLFVIITDGQENASHLFSRKQVFNMIKHQRETYKWEFIFLGANQDSIAEAESLGISANNAVTFDADANNSGRMMRGLANAVVNYRSGNVTSCDTIYGQNEYNNSK